MNIADRIGHLKAKVQIQTGHKAVGLLLGEDQMVELQCHLAETGLPRGSVVTEYDGMRISMQAGVDGIAVVTERSELRPIGRAAIRDQMQRVVTRFIGAHPIIF